MPFFSPEENTILVEHTKHKGVLGDFYLTNKRLVFERFSGLIVRKAYVTLDLPLEAVQAVKVEGLVMKHLTVYSKKGFVGSFPAVLEFSVSDPNVWSEKILGAVEERHNLIDKREKLDALVDFAALKDFMTKGGFFLQTVKCPECSAPLRLPESGNQILCSHCGNTILAQDIFEKIRSII